MLEELIILIYEFYRIFYEMEKPILVWNVFYFNFLFHIVNIYTFFIMI
jgi:hypothetical protein